MVENVFENKTKVELDNSTTYAAILSDIGIKEAKDEILENTKVMEFLDYIVENNIKLLSAKHYPSLSIGEKTLIYLVENLKSFETLVKILNIASVRENVMYNHEEIVKWYNVYDPEKLPWFAYDEHILLLDNEYLKYAGVDWTQNVFIKLNSWLETVDGHYELTKNKLNEDDMEYFNPFYDNVRKLHIEQQKGRLKQAIDFLINSTLEK